jgi:hypothetical protein
MLSAFDSSFAIESFDAGAKISGILVGLGSAAGFCSEGSDCDSMLESPGSEIS